ncbi:hypothetical protein GUJ93_ZPchr0002g25807 [Zizania palustris]|nr:hypothetical protein GUJ93_ZPchr0002g25807 [Zizania palustris]
MHIVDRIVLRLQLDFDSVRVGVSDENLKRRIEENVNGGERQVYVAGEGIDMVLVDALKAKYTNVHYLDEFEDLWETDSNWFLEMKRLNGGVPVEFDGYMRELVDREVFLKGKNKVEAPPLAELRLHRPRSISVDCSPSFCLHRQALSPPEQNTKRLRGASSRGQPEMTTLPRRVCVTGAGGFIGSWLVKLLLSRGYAVHATVRDPDDPKNAFLKQLEKAPENLSLFKADVLDGDSLRAAFAGCEGVFHPASPVPDDKTVDPEKEVMAPTVKGTENVLEACSAASVQKLVMVSSIAAVCFNPSYDQDRLKDETIWSDKEFCKEYENWYSLAKTEAEEMSLKYAEKNGLHVVTLLPCLVFGPLLQTVHLNTTTKVLLFMIKGGPDIMNNKFWPIIDVRDVADALLLVFEKAGTSERYICSTDQIDLKDVLNLMKSMYPNFSYADK